MNAAMMTRAFSTAPSKSRDITTSRSWRIRTDHSLCGARIRSGFGMVERMITLTRQLHAYQVEAMNLMVPLLRYNRGDDQ